MGLNLGTGSIGGLYLGSTEITKAYLGATEVYAISVNSLLTGLVSYWNMEESSGDPVDIVGSNTLTLTGSSLSVTGKLGNARPFLNDIAKIADNANISTGDIDFTFATWFNPSVTTNQDIIAKDDQTTGDREFLISVSSTKFRFGVFDDSGIFTQVVADTFGNISTGNWYFVLAWHDSVNNELGISVNGIEDTLSYSGGVRDGGSDFAIGGRPVSPTATNLVNGNIDDTAFWKRILTTEEKSTLYNSGTGLAYPFT